MHFKCNRQDKMLMCRDISVAFMGILLVKLLWISLDVLTNCGSFSLGCDSQATMHQTILPIVIQLFSCQNTTKQLC